MIQQYSKYKDSEIDWIGEIPIHWKNHRVDWITTLIRGNTGLKKDELLEEGEYVALQYGKTYKVDEVNDAFKYFVGNEYYKKNQIVNLGDTIFISTSETIEDLGHSCFYNREDLGLIGGEQILLKPDSKFIFDKYLYYYSKKIGRELQRSAKGLKVLRFKIDDIKQISIPLPPIQEQIQIADYLEKKTTTIDKKIDLLKQKIAHYQTLRKSLIHETITKGLDKNVKLKDSGIQWIGQIPEHWEVKRFKDTIRKYTTGGTPSKSNTSYFDGDNVWVCISDIDDKNIIDNSKIKLTSEAINDANIVKTPKGSLLYSFKLSIGKMAFANCDLYTNEAILSIFQNKKIDLMFFYFMLPKYMNLASKENIYGAKMLNQKLIANALLVLPPIQEQQQIAHYLDTKTQAMDTIIATIKDQIATLKELRKTLINDVVTGKLKITAR